MLVVLVIIIKIINHILIYIIYCEIYLNNMTYLYDSYKV